LWYIDWPFSTRRWIGGRGRVQARLRVRLGSYCCTYLVRMPDGCKCTKREDQNPYLDGDKVYIHQYYELYLYIYTMLCIHQCVLN
jgi:hypothetical protein